jgi:hypothetical protein
MKPEFWESEKAGRMSPLARLTFLGLISLADDAGRGRSGIGFLMGRLHPYGVGVTVESLSESLQEIEKNGLVVLYDGSDGCSFYHLPGFLDNQRIDKPSESKLPPPSKKSSKNPPRILQESSKNVLGSIGEEGNGRDRKGMDIAACSTPPEKKPRTGVQGIMRAFKDAKGIDMDNAEWDKLNFKRFARSAADILKVFGGNADAAILYVLKKGQELDDKELKSWGLEAIARAAATDGRVLDFQRGEENGPENFTLDADRVYGPRRLGGVTRAGEIAGDALAGLREQAALPGRVPGQLGGSQPDSFDDEPFTP